MRWFNCDGPGAASGRFATMAEALKGRPAGARLGAIIAGPNCWNGKQLDIPDHRSLLPFFKAGAWYMNDGTADAWHFSSDRIAGMPNLPAGTSFHAD